MSCHVMMRGYAHEQDFGMALRCQSEVTYVHCSSGFSDAWSLLNCMVCRHPVIHQSMQEISCSPLQICHSPRLLP